MNLLVFVGTILMAVAISECQDLVDQVFGEALLNSLRPELRSKLEEIHRTGVFKSKTESQTARIVKSLMTPEEIKELEAAYKKLILPMLQKTVREQTGRQIDNLDDVPLNFGDDEDDEAAVDDFKTESEEQMERKIRENKAKEKKIKNEDSPRTVNVDGEIKKSGEGKKQNEDKQAKKDKPGTGKKNNDKSRVKEEL